MNTSGYADLLNRNVIAEGELTVDVLIMPNLDPNSIPYIDSDNTIEDIVLNNGQLIIGKTGDAPQAHHLSGTTNQVNVVNGPGTITLSLPQDISTSSSPTFDDMTLNSLNTVPISDYIITPSTSDLDMDNHNISNVNSLNGTLVSNYLKTPSTVDLDMNNHFISNFNSLRPLNSNLNIGNNTTMPVSSFGTINIGDLTTSLGDSSVNIGLQNVARNQSVCIGKESTSGNRSTVIGYRSGSGVSTDCCVYGHDNSSQATSADIFGVNRTNNQANSLLLGNGSYTNIRANSTCDLGTSSVPFQNIYSNASLNGTVNNRLVNDIVSNTSTGTLNNLVSFVSDKVIKDAGIPSSQITTNTSNIATNTANISTNTANIATNTANITSLQTKTQNQSATAGNTNFTGTLQQGGVNVATVADLGDYVEKTGDSMTGNLNMTTNNISNVGSLSGSTNTRTADNILSCTTNPAYGRIAMFSFNNKVLEDSTYSVFDVVSGPAAAVNNNLPSFNTTSGKLIKDSGISALDVVTGPASATVNNIPLYSSTSGKVITTSTSTTGTIGGLNVGPTQTITVPGKMNLMGTNASINGPHVNVYTASDQYPITQYLNYAHDNVAQNYDAYWDGTNWKSSHSGSNFQIYKFINQLQFNYASGIAPGSTITSWNYAGFMNNAGLLTWNKQVKITDTTDSTSTTTGSLVTAGGLAVAKQVRIGGKVTISTSAGLTGLDLASADSYASLRVIQSLGGPDNHLYLNYNSGTTSYCYLYSNNAVSVKVEGSNVGIGMSPVTGGGNTNNLQIANGAGPTTTVTGGGCLYVNAGRLFYKGSSGTVTQLAPA